MTAEGPYKVIAQAIVDYHSQGLCPLDGPCDSCDCFDATHNLERDETKHVLTKLAEAGYDIVHTPEPPPEPPKEAPSEARWWRISREWYIAAPTASEALDASKGQPHSDTYVTLLRNPCTRCQYLACICIPETW